MRRLDSVATRLGTAGELLVFFWSHKWWWLTPMVVVLLSMFALIVLAESSGLAPFIYALF